MFNTCSILGLILDQAADKPLMTTLIATLTVPPHVRVHLKLWTWSWWILRNRTPSERRSNSDMKNLGIPPFLTHALGIVAPGSKYTGTVIPTDSKSDSRNQLSTRIQRSKIIDHPRNVYPGLCDDFPCSDRLSEHMTKLLSFRRVYLLDFPSACFHHTNVIGQRPLFSVN